MRGHLEYFEYECYFIADDIWFPWTDIFLCKDNYKFIIMEGEYSGEDAKIVIKNKRVTLNCNGFEIENINKIKVDFKQGGL